MVKNIKSVLIKNTEKKLITFSDIDFLPKIQNIADIIKGHVSDGINNLK